MKIQSLVYLAAPFFIAGTATAKIVSTTATEVRFAYEAHFETTSKEPAVTAALEHAKYLFGYMQGREITKIFGVDRRFDGIGAPRWAPEIKVLSESQSGAERQIRYQVNGYLILQNKAAATLLQRQTWNITLPASLEHFYAKKCDDLYHSERSAFWYEYNPFRKGCEHLRREPLAHPVKIILAPTSQVPRTTISNFEEIRGDNGNDGLFQIVTVNGFADDEKAADDSGRVNYEGTNAWLRARDFADLVIDSSPDHPLHQFDRIVHRADGRVVHVQIIRLLAETMLEESADKTYANFMVDALKSADVVIYNGHSGLGANLDLAKLEKETGTSVALNPEKKQFFYFDSCSSYSYYLGMFTGRKQPGSLAVMTNGLASTFEANASKLHQLLETLLDFDHPVPTWESVINKAEGAWDADRFLLSVDLGDITTKEETTRSTLAR